MVIDPFIHQMVLRNVFNAATQRGKSVYAVPMDDPRRGEFRNWIKEWLTGLGLRYIAWEYTPLTFCQEIENLKREANKHHSAVLVPGMITLGVSQKLIALYLKYLWLLGNAEKMPLSPPLDSRVFAAVGLKIAGGFKGIDDMQVLQDAWAKVDAYAAKQGMRSGTIWESRWWTDSDDEYAAE